MSIHTIDTSVIVKLAGPFLETCTKLGIEIVMVTQVRGQCQVLSNVKNDEVVVGRMQKAIVALAMSHMGEPEPDLSNLASLNIKGRG